jgi:hypothetical protein
MTRHDLPRRHNRVTTLPAGGCDACEARPASTFPPRHNLSHPYAHLYARTHAHAHMRGSLGNAEKVVTL